MTGPFAPVPPDGADRWSDQDQVEPRTPEPPPEPPTDPPTDPPTTPGEVTPEPVETPAVETPAVEAEPVEAELVEAEPVEPQPAGASPGRRGVLPLVLVGLLTALMVAGVAFLGLRLRAEVQTETARDEAVAASRDAARLLFSYDYATLEEDFAKGLSVTTGKFTDEYSKTTKQVVTDVARQYKAVVVAAVVESAVVGASPHEVTTLVFLNQATTSTRVEGRRVDQSRVLMRLVEKDGRWLVAEVQAL